MDYSKKTELRIMSHNIWCGPVYNRDLHMRDISAIFPTFSVFRK